MNSGKETIGAVTFWAIGNIAKQCWVKNKPRPGAPPLYEAHLRKVWAKNGFWTEPLAPLLVKWHGEAQDRQESGAGPKSV